MRTLRLVSASSLLLASPAMSATYSVDGWATGLAQDKQAAGDTPVSAAGAAEGASFSGFATNVDSGYATAFASEGLSDITDYNDSAGDHYYGLDARVLADVRYTFEIVGPVTGTLIPVDIMANVSATSLDVPAPVGGVRGYYAPVVAGASASVTVQYAEGDAPVGGPANGLLANFVASTSYDYHYFVDGGAGYSAPVLLGNRGPDSQSVMIAANFDVTVNIVAEAGAQFASTYASYTETARGGATADPTFTIDEPGYESYRIVGVPEAPAVAAPEASTWAMTLIGFAGIGLGGRRGWLRLRRERPLCL
jgi:hypothetical protein